MQILIISVDSKPYIQRVTCFYEDSCTWDILMRQVNSDMSDFNRLPYSDCKDQKLLTR